VPKKRSASASLDPLREQIDRIDGQVLRLINRRARLAQRIGQAKQQDKTITYVPSRERQIMARLSELNPGPLSDSAVQAIYREIISASRALEQLPKVAYFGPAASYTHIAAREQFGAQAEFVSASTIPQVFAEIEQGRANYGVVPIENSSEGAVGVTLDMFVESSLHIIAERSVAIDHCLLSRAKRMERVKRVLAHPQALGQCRRWLATHLAGVTIEEASSNSRAAELATADSHTAAIAGRLAAEEYRLNLLATNIQDQAANVTRFAVIGHEQPSKPTGHDKTALFLSVRNQAGVLHSLLKPFADNAVNMLRIESRPFKGKPWEYLFFVDVEGHVSDAPLVRALQGIEPLCIEVKILGSYATAKHASGNLRRPTRPLVRSE
jgi:chorismate mutase/prephenate dehydratase